MWGTEKEWSSCNKKVNLVFVLGHEEMHAKMVLVMFATLFAGQILLFVWRKKHPRSYNAATLLGMWLIPLGYSIYLSHKRFIAIWVFYSIITGIICRKVYLCCLRFWKKLILIRHPVDRWTDGRRVLSTITFWKCSKSRMALALPATHSSSLPSSAFRQCSWSNRKRGWTWQFYYYFMVSTLALLRKTLPTCAQIEWRRR